jgi:hypothetical protein
MCSTDLPRGPTIPPPRRGGYINKQSLPRVAHRPQCSGRCSTRGYIPRPRWGRKVRHGNSGTTAWPRFGEPMIARGPRRCAAGDRRILLESELRARGILFGRGRLAEKAAEVDELFLAGCPLRQFHACPLGDELGRVHAGIMTMRGAVAKRYPPPGALWHVKDQLKLSHCRERPGKSPSAAFRGNASVTCARSGLRGVARLACPAVGIASGHQPRLDKPAVPQPIENAHVAEALRFGGVSP